MALPDLIKRLEVLNAERGPEYVSEFEKVLAGIAALEEPDAIEALAGFFEDDAPFDELMFSIIHTIERFDDDVYVPRLLEVSELICRKSPRWASILFMRALNSEATRVELVRQLRNAAPPIKSCLRNLMEKINARSPQFLAKTVAVTVAAS